MIESIEFKNFKALRDTTLPLSPCTILVGANGSGKSTVLEALEAVRARQAIPFVRIATASVRDDRNIVSVQVSLKWGEPHLGAEPMRQWTRGGNLTQGNRPGTKGADQVEPLISRIRVYSLDAAAIAAPAMVSDNIELAGNGAGLAAVLDALDDKQPERFDEINSQVGQWLPEFDRILFKRPAPGKKSIVLRTREGQYEIAATDLSEGTLLALTMLTLAYLPDPPSLIGLEEPDRSIHPRLLRRVQDAIYRLSHPDSCGEKREPVQVIATTHSPYFLDLFKDHPEEIVIANKVGLDVQFQRLSEQPHIQELLEEAHLGDIWYTGILGGVPANS